MADREDATTLLDAFETYAPSPSDDRTPKLGVVQAVATDKTSKSCRVLFDGETVVGLKFYPCVSTYDPVIGNRVVVLPAGSTTSWVIVGAVASGFPTGRVIAGTGIDLTGGDDSTVGVQKFFDTCSDGDTIIVPGGAVIRLTGIISVKKRVTLTGAGELRWTSGIEHTPALSLEVNGIVVDRVRMVNTCLPASSGEKQAGIWMSGYNQTVSNSYIDGFQQAVNVSPFGEFYGCSITNNTIVNVRGSGGGPNSDSPEGEDRGDGIITWGAETRIVGNHVSAFPGTDARIGIHCESLAVYESVHGPHSSSLVPITGNMVAGSFRRSIVSEGIFGANISGNTVADATWWGIGLIGGDGSICSNNTIIWSRTNADNQGSAFQPRRSAIMVYGVGVNTVVANNVIRVEANAVMPFGISAQTNGSGQRDGLLISHNVIRDEQGSMYAGIYLDGGGGAMSDTRVLGNTIRGASSFGIYSWNGTDIEICNNRVSGMPNRVTDAIVCDGSGTGAIVEANKIYGSNTAVKVLGRNAVTTVKQNLIYDANVGINFTGTAIVDLSGNTTIAVTTATVH